MKNLKKFIVFSVLLVSIISTPYKSVNAMNNGSYTLGQVENIFFDYLKDNDLEYEKGTEEYYNYLISILTEDADAELAKLDKYDLILFYASEYVTSVQDELVSLNIYNKINEDSSKDPIRAIRDKTIEELKKEIVEEEAKVEEELDEFKKNNEEIVSPFASYNATTAAAYARKHYNSPNSLYNNYIADCTNFVSQVVFAGGKAKSKPSSIPTGVSSTTTYWYSERYEEWLSNTFYYKWKEASSWIRVTDFYTYMAKTQSVTRSTSKSTIINNAKVGDIVQFKRADGTWYHSMVVTKKANGTIYLTGRSTSSLDKDINNITATEFRVIKF